MFHRCNKCDVGFLAEPDMKSHNKESHSNETEPEAAPREADVTSSAEAPSHDKPERRRSSHTDNAKRSSGNVKKYSQSRQPPHQVN